MIDLDLEKEVMDKTEADLYEDQPKVAVAPDVEYLAVMEWMQGKTDNQPEAVIKLLPELEKKLTASLFFVAAKEMARAEQLSQFTHEAEKVLFAPEDIPSLSTDPDELMKRYKMARTAKSDTMEFARKTLVQNGTKAFEGNVEGQAILTMLNSMSPAELKRVKEALIAGELQREPEEDTDTELL